MPFWPSLPVLTALCVVLCPGAPGALEPVVDLLEQHYSQQQAGLVDDVWPLLLHTTGNATDTLQPEQVRAHRLDGLAQVRVTQQAHSKASQSPSARAQLRAPGISSAQMKLLQLVWVAWRAGQPVAG